MAFAAVVSFEIQQKERVKDEERRVVDDDSGGTRRRFGVVI
jgi:hypothetical protein